MRQALLLLVFIPFVVGSVPPPATLVGVGASYIAPHGGYELNAALQKVGAQWWYGWRPNPGGDGVPMIWGPSDLGKPVSGDAAWIMFYNEPENEYQSDVDPAPAATDWPVLLRTYPGRRYVSPGCYSVEWLEEWLPLVEVKPDALAAHCYMMMGGEGGCKSHLERFIALAAQYGIGEVWVTEFAYVPISGEGYDAAVAWMLDITAWMEVQPMITRYAWFELAYTGAEPWAWGTDRNTSLVDYDTGRLTKLGCAYVGGCARDAAADVNEDGFVDILDVVTVGSPANFGRPVR